jgi:O-antigen ligase/Flp pilus assembly protein TadD
MPSEGSAKQIARWVALGALFLLPFTPLVVVNSYFFPFITGKAFYLRILIELLVGAWIVLALLDKQYRPRISWIGWGVIGFVVWMFIADLFAVNVLKAFWSNFERMEGWVLLIHLLGLFFAASAVLRVEKKWRSWFFISLGASLIVSGYALLQLGGVLAIHQGSTRIDATFGNSAYLAIYLLFSIFVSLWLAFSPPPGKTKQNTWLKWILILIAFLEAVLLFFTETRGTVLGLLFGLALATFLTILIAGARTRRYAAITLALIIIIVGGVYLARNSSFVQNNDVLHRVTSISLSDGQTRFAIWHMAFEGMLERPIVGWGQEGFNYVFNKFYDPSLYTQEQWFDRAHNAFLDWLVAGGIPAFLLYISLYASALVLLWKSPQLSRSERTLLTGALVGYAIHNLFVFDNLYSYIYFFAILAFIDSQVARPVKWIEEAPVLSDTQGMIYALPIAAVVCAGIIWCVNITQMESASNLITALSSDDISQSLAIFENFSAHPIPEMQEVREQLVTFEGEVIQSQEATDAQKQQVATLAISEMQKQVASYPLDAREVMELSYAYRAAGDNPDALKAVQEAILLSPKKEEFYLEEGTLDWELNDVQSAQQAFNTAYALGPSFSDLAVYAAGGDIAAGDEAAGDKILLATFGTINVDSDVLSAAYYQGKDWPQLIALWKERAASPDATVETLFGLAAAYYAAGDNAQAIATIQAAVAEYPDAAASGAAAIKQIQEGE